MRYSGIGGQAVIEGVMMKNRDKCAVAVRKPAGDIEVSNRTCSDIRKKSILARIPIIRGMISFVESLTLGMSTLNYSASFFEEEEEKSKSKSKSKEDDSIVMGLVLVLGIILAIGIFIVAPFLITESLRRIVRSPQLRGLIEGLIRVILFVIYVKLISLTKDIRRVFMYHGAEHKSINCIENGEELTVQNVKRQSMRHKRCGTSFLLIVMFLSILLFMFIVVDNIWLRMLFRVLLIPVIAGIAYEWIRFAGRHDNAFVNLISAPGLWLQKLTTIEPDNEMIEVAIASVEAVFDWKTFVYLDDDAEDDGIEVVSLDEDEGDEDSILSALDRFFEAPEEKEEKDEA